MKLRAKRFFFVFMVLAFFSAGSAMGQIDKIIQSCEQHIQHPYLSDGQEYRTLLNQDEVGEFRIVFYGGSTYRIVSCGGEENNIIFTVFDQEKNEIFTNRDKPNTPYWDFKFTSTMVCTVETELPSGVTSGFSMLLVGFKQQ